MKNPGLTVDYFEEIAERAEELALKDHSVKPGKIWKIIWKEMVAKNHTWKGLNNRQVMNKIHNVRKADGDTPRQIFEKLEYPNLRKEKNPITIGGSLPTCLIVMLNQTRFGVQLDGKILS